MLDKKLNCWPKEWIEDNSKVTARASAFWPQYYESIFISNNGNKELSAILYNNIDTTDWYKNLKKTPIHSDINFVAIFHWKAVNNIYLVGDRNKSGVYYLEANDIGHYIKNIVSHRLFNL